MTTDKFLRRSEIITQHLSTIASSACLQGEGGLLPAHPRVIAVVNAQERLLSAIEALLEGAEEETPPPNTV